MKVLVTERCEMDLDTFLTEFAPTYEDRMCAFAKLRTFQPARSSPAMANHLCLFPIVIAVQWFHKENMAHRDIKGANILLTVRDDYPSRPVEIRLADLGAVSRRTDVAALARTCIGTPGAMAPEVLRCHPEVSALPGAAARYDALAADIWSLGVLACVARHVLTFDAS
jgi:serine/threonine protein kinase